MQTKQCNICLQELSIVSFNRVGRHFRKSCKTCLNPKKALEDKLAPTPIIQVQLKGIQTVEVIFNHTPIQMHVKEQGLVMDPSHDRAFDFGGVGKILLSGTKDKLWVYLLGANSESLNYGGWSPSFETQLSIENHKLISTDLDYTDCDFSQDFDSSTLPAIRSDFWVENLSHIIDFIEENLRETYLTSEEMDKIYSLIGQIRRGGLDSRFAQAFLYSRTDSNKFEYTPTTPIKKKVKEEAKKELPSSSSPDIGKLEEIAKLLGIDLAV